MSEIGSDEISTRKEAHLDFSPARHLLLIATMIALESYLQKLSANLRMCLSCHRLAERDRLFCRICALSLLKCRRQNWVRFENGVPTLSLFNWREGEHAVLQKFAQNLKGGGVAAIFAALAGDLSSLRAGLYPSLKENICFVPAPGSSRGRDHAEELAFQLANIWGGRYEPRLSRAPDHSAQKRKGLHERGQKRFGVTELSKDFTGSVVFVDDVLTTGSTANAAYRALGKPKMFEIWTLFYRPRLRGLRA